MSQKEILEASLSASQMVNLSQFINAETEKRTSEYIRIIPDRENRKIHFFRGIDELADNLIHTVLEDCRIKLSLFRKDLNYSDIQVINLHHNQANSVLVWLNSLKYEKTETQITLDYLPVNNSQNIDNSDLNQNSLILSYKSESGNEFTTQIDETYKHTNTRLATLA